MVDNSEHIKQGEADLPLRRWNLTTTQYLVGPTHPIIDLLFFKNLLSH